MGAPDAGTEASPLRAPREAAQRWRMVVARAAIDAGRQQRELQAAWEASLAASGLPVAGLDASTPRPRFAIAAPLAAAIPGEAELVDVWLVERLPRWRVREGLAQGLPDGHRLVDVFDVWLGESALPGQVVASVYRADLEPGPDPSALRTVSAAMLADGSIPRTRRKGDGTVAYDLRPFLDELDVIVEDGGGVHVRMTLRHDPERGVGRPDEVLGELGDRLGSPPTIRSLVRERLLLVADREPARVPATEQARAANAEGKRDRR